jgi:integrase/recombinase XerD
MGKLRIDWSTKSADEHKQDTLVKNYRRYLTNQGYRYHTINLYSDRVGKFIEFSRTIEPCTKNADEFRELLIDQGASKSHVNNTVFALKKYFEMKNIDWSTTILTRNDSLPYYFDENDILNIFSVCNNIKHLAMLKTLFFGCLRSGELSKLEDKDLNLDERSLRLRETKGGRDDIALLNDECVETLRIYLNIRPKIEIGGKYPLFYTDNFNLWDRGDIHRMFMGYKKKARIKKPGAVHVFSRHSPATLMVAKGCDIRIIKEVLRHKDIRTTLRYAHVADSTKRQMYEQYLVL